MLSSMNEDQVEQKVVKLASELTEHLDEPHIQIGVTWKGDDGGTCFVSYGTGNTLTRHKICDLMQQQFGFMEEGEDEETPKG